MIFFQLALIVVIAVQMTPKLIVGPMDWCGPMNFRHTFLDTSGVWPGSFLQPQHKGVRSAAGSVVGGFTGVGGLGVGGWRLAACRACDQLKQIAYERLATKHLVLELLGLD